MFITALIMGFAGSLHCAGMCSPLAMAVTNAQSRAMYNRILYNLGRITTYGLLGVIIASIGYILPFTKFQNILSIALGVSLIMMAAIGITGLNIPVITPIMIRFTGVLKTFFSKFIHNKSPWALLFLGSLNGLLPCGLTLLALSFCLTANSPLEGFVYMFTFGIGTLPVMLGLVSIFNIITLKLKWNIKSVTTGLMVLSGMLLIARVFILHIPEGHPEHSSFIDIVICR